VRRVSTLFECGAGRSQLLPTAPRAVNQDDVFGIGRETTGDSHGFRQQRERLAAHLDAELRLDPDDLATPASGGLDSQRRSQSQLCYP
jgi:hypothetical protein